jgi:transcriptional regulator with XRE-family HTH domain
VATESLTWAEGNRLIRTIGREDYLASRITAERRKRGWSQSELSRRLKAVGADMHQTAISKIEHPQHGRRAITVDEAIAFARIFGLPFGELLLPPDSLQRVATWRAITEGPAALAQYQLAEAAYEALVRQIAMATVGDPYWAGQLVDQLERARAAEKPGELPTRSTFLLDVMKLCSDLADVLDPDTAPPTQKMGKPKR